MVIMEQSETLLLCGGTHVMVEELVLCHAVSLLICREQSNVDEGSIQLLPQVKESMAT